MEAHLSVFNETRVLVTGGAGFVGSHLVDALVKLNARVTVVDNLITGSRENIEEPLESGAIQFIEADASFPVESYYQGPSDMVFHLASPASPVDFETMPKDIYRVNSYGTEYLASYAATHNARFLFASTSEVYGDPDIHPQTEDYFGNVNPVGPRACYDESKRFGEMVTSVYGKQDNLDARIVRIFNTYGPRMQPEDGRAIPTFIRQALANEPLTVHGDGSQTRSYCYVSDLVTYILLLMVADAARNEVVNIGNPEELSVQRTAKLVMDAVGSTAGITHVERPEDDPARRQPDISKAAALTGFTPEVNFAGGLERTVAYFMQRK